MTVIPMGRIMRGILMDGQARVLLCDTTVMAGAARRIHHASNVCTAALGRGISAAALLTASTEEQTSSLTMTIKGDGPAGALVVVAHGFQIKAYIDHPRVQLPLRTDQKLDVGGAIGPEGRITVIRDMGLKEPYIGHCSLVSGEIGEDVASYCVTSEQQPTLCSLGVLVGEDEVLSSGGLLVQPLPGCSEEVLSALELRSPIFADISAHLLEHSIEELHELFFRGLKPEILSVEALSYACDCSRVKMEQVLLSLGRKDLEDMIQKDHGAEISCVFCHERHRFSEEALQHLLAHA